MSELDAFLAAVDLDELAVARDRLGPLTPEEESRLAAHALGEDAQARANVLMHPDLLEPEVRSDALLRGLQDGPDSYLALAAAVGVSVLGPAGLPDQRGDLVAELLDLVAAHAGPLGARAALALHGLLSTTDAAEVAPLLVHPDRTVRRNLLAAVLEAVGPAGLRALLDSPGFVDPDEADAVRRRLEEDGVTLDDGAPTPAPLLPNLPSRAEWDG